MAGSRAKDNFYRPTEYDAPKRTAAHLKSCLSKDKLADEFLTNWFPLAIIRTLEFYECDRIAFFSMAEFGVYIRRKPSYEDRHEAF